MLEKCLPRNDYMDVPWENYAAMWEPEIARMMARAPFVAVLAPQVNGKGGR